MLIQCRIKLTKQIEQILVKNYMMTLSGFHCTLFFCSLNLSMMTPTNRLRVKKLPKMMKETKYKYM